MQMRVVEVECKCGKVLWKYQKRGRGRLIKCYIPRILQDNIGVDPKAPIGKEIMCTKCKKRVGTVFGIKGIRAVKLNQGQIHPIRLG